MDGHDEKKSAGGGGCKCDKFHGGMLQTNADFSSGTFRQQSRKFSREHDRMHNMDGDG
jgi:hypothetical protein